MSRPQFAVAAVTFALTLALSPHVERAVVAGVGLAVAVHLWRELRLDIDVEAPGDTLHLSSARRHLVRHGPGLEDRLIRVLADHPAAERLVVHLDGVGRLDHSGALALRNVLELARSAGLSADVDGVPAHAERSSPPCGRDGQRSTGQPCCSHVPTPPSATWMTWSAPWRWSSEAATALRWPEAQITATGRAGSIPSGIPCTSW